MSNIRERCRFNCVVCIFEESKKIFTKEAFNDDVIYKRMINTLF